MVCSIFVYSMCFWFLIFVCKIHSFIIVGIFFIVIVFFSQRSGLDPLRLMEMLLPSVSMLMPLKCFHTAVSTSFILIS